MKSLLCDDYTKEDLFELAFKDALTGVYNRNALDVMRNTYDNVQCFVTVVDVDNLKHINDTYGHASGDTTIMEVTKQLQMQGHEIIRLGGDEFLMLSQQAIKGAIVGASYGCVFKQSSELLSDAMRRADKLLYVEKGAKKHD